ncbi:4971_t:CDS:2, partial [Funneliformis caledonium]
MKNVLYIVENYKDMAMSQMIHCETNSNFFASMKKYMKVSEEIFIPDILGLRDPNIIYNLQTRVNSIYPSIFNTPSILTKLKITKLTTTMQKSIEIKELGMHLSPEATLALAVEYESLKKIGDAS